MRKHMLDFISGSESHAVRGLRILIEYFYALDVLEPLHDVNIRIVSVFGSARAKPMSKGYEDAVKLGTLLYKNGFGVVTGASQGIMEAANKGVSLAIVEDLKRSKKFSNKTEKQIMASNQYKNILNVYSLGLKISLPFEAECNPHLGKTATFHYFMVRKFFFATLSSAFIACEGGWGTRDELYEMMTLVQTGKMELMPIIYITSEPRHINVDLDFAVKGGYISPLDLKLIQVVDDYKKAVEIVKKFYSNVKYIQYSKTGYIKVHLITELTPAQKKTVTNLVNKKHKDVFKGGVKIGSDRLEFFNYVHKSYGILREVIDAISV
ncbi:MAG: LOG family protein [Deltaproteobacteria bacterium]|nr:LOG family protein [Deltaproteobacteria bacterium]